MKKRAYLFSLAGVLLFSSFMLFNSCGIYTTTLPLNPPFDKNQDSEALNFSGYNPEAHFAGYNFYYKEDVEDFYKVCGYKKTMPWPTIPKEAFVPVIPPEFTGYVDFDDKTGDDPPRYVFTVKVSNLYPQDDFSRSFYELHNDSPDRPQFYFAVSAVGEEDEESERIEFTVWP
jgi:hypothetical protein